MAIIVRYALTLNEPNLLPADVKRIELNVQRHDVRIAADSPMRLESKFLTVRLTQNGPDDLKPFPRCVQSCQNIATRVQILQMICMDARKARNVQRVNAVSSFQSF
jgi:hypothetical protein